MRQISSFDKNISANTKFVNYFTFDFYSNLSTLNALKFVTFYLFLKPCQQLSPYLLKVRLGFKGNIIVL